MVGFKFGTVCDGKISRRVKNDKSPGAAASAIVDEDEAGREDRIVATGWVGKTSGDFGTLRA